MIPTPHPRAFEWCRRATLAVLVSAALDSEVGVFDLTSLHLLERIKVPGSGADAILFEPVTKRVFVFCGGSGNAVALDATTYAILGTIPLGGRPEFAVADGRGEV